MDKQLNNSPESVDFSVSSKQSIGPDLRQRLHSAELFDKAREVVIEHGGEQYRLRLTRQGKLILTK